MHVYFIQGTDGGPIKIGSSVDPKSRFNDIQTCSPVRLSLLATIDGGPWLENALHRHFKIDRLHGEWFQPTPELRGLIADIQSGKEFSRIKSTFKITFGVAGIIEHWPSRAAFAMEVGVTDWHARRWAREQFVPRRFWPDIIEAADARGFSDIDYQLLYTIWKAFYSRKGRNTPQEKEGA